MDNFSSEALKAGIKPNKPVEEMTDEEIKEFATKNPDQMVELLKIWLNE